MAHSLTQGGGAQGGEDEHLPLVAMLLDQCYQESLVAPMPMPQGPAQDGRGEGRGGRKNRGRNKKAPTVAPAANGAGDTSPAANDAGDVPRKRRRSRRRRGGDAATGENPQPARQTPGEAHD